MPMGMGVTRYRSFLGYTYNYASGTQELHWFSTRRPPGGHRTTVMYVTFHLHVPMQMFNRLDSICSNTVMQQYIKEIATVSVATDTYLFQACVSVCMGLECIR